MIATMNVKKVPIAVENKAMALFEELLEHLRIDDDSFVRSQPCDQSDDHYKCRADDSFVRSQPRDQSDDHYKCREPVCVSWPYQESRTQKFYLEKFDELRNLRQTTDWTNEAARHKFFQAFYLFVIRTWRGKLPDTKDLKWYWKRGDVEYVPDYVNNFLQKEVVDWLLLDCVEKRYRSDSHFHLSNILISFVASSKEYKDTLEIDENGQPLVFRTTALHKAARSQQYCIVEVLFKIYNKFHVNYTDESGLSHFHVACMCGCVEVVEKFLEARHDPNLIWTATGDTPLNLVLKSRHKWPLDLALDRNLQATVELLLRCGASPNAIEAKESTPSMDDKNQRVHVDHRDDLGRTPLKLAVDPNAIDANKSTPSMDDKNQSVHVDHRDYFGRTPLELAVAYNLPKAFELLLHHGADFSGFVLPANIDLVNRFVGGPYEMLGYLRVASSFLTVIEILQAKKCEVPPHHAWKIKTVFEKSFSLAKLVKNWYDDVEFVAIADAILITGCLSLYNLVRLHPKEAARLVNYRDYHNFIHSRMVEIGLPERHRINCLLHLSRLMWEKFSQSLTKSSTKHT